MDRVIEFKNVSKKYGDKYAVKDVSLIINKGDFITVIGSSGSGKTTLMKMINRLVIPEEGEVIVNGVNVMDEDVIALRRRIGYAIQGNILFPHMTVRENIVYVLRLLGCIESYIEKRVHELLELVSLDEDVLDRYPSQLSGGQQQRVGFARSFAARPSILLMDEPFGAIDAITKNQLQKDLKKIHEKKKNTVVFITHDILEALTLATKVVVFNEGQIEQYDTPENIMENPATPFVKELTDMVKMKHDIVV